MVGLYDEAISVYGAERVLNGDVPYRDFWTIYPPGQFYTLATLFKIFGPSILVERIYDTVLRSLICILVFLTAVRLASPGWGLVVWLVVAVWLKYLGNYAYPNIPAMLFSLLSLYFLLGFFCKERSNIRLFVAGIFVGVAGLFRHDSGLYLFLSEVLVVFPFAFFFLLPKNGEEGLLRRLVKLTPYACVYLFGAAFPILPVAVYFLSTVPVQTIIDDLIIFPLKVFPSVRSVPFPAPLPDGFALSRGEASLFQYLAQLSERWIFYFSLSVLLATCVFFALGRCRSLQEGNKGPLVSSWNWETVLLLVFGLVSLNNLRVRPDLAHLLPSFVLAAVLSAGLGLKLFTKASVRKGLLLLGAFLTIGLLLVNPFYRWLTPELPGTYGALTLNHNLERARGAGVYPNQAEAVRFVQGISFPWERIFVGNDRHDSIYTNDIMFYFLSGLPSVTKYHELFPGLATSLAVQTEIVGELKKNNVRHIVRLSPFPHFKNREVTNEPVPVSVLDDFITQNYQPVQRFGLWSVWERK